MTSKKNVVIKQPWVIAHRGASWEAPENTRSAFDTALRYPIDGIECDVQLSKDHIPVIYHDRTLGKINGSRTRISDFTVRKLSGQDWGSPFSKKFSGEQLLSLEEMLQLYRGRTRLLIEIKARKHDIESGRSVLLTKEVLRIVERHLSMEELENIFILSFDPNVIILAASIMPQLNYVLNIRECIGDTIETPSCNQCLHGFCIRISQLTPQFVEDAHKLNKRIFTYSCNVPRQLDKAINLGVDAILTDNPGWLVKKLDRLT